MTTIPLSLLDGDTLVIDNSSIELQTTCPRAAQYGLCLRKRTTCERTALRFGGIAHKILECRYRSSGNFLEQTPMIQNEMVKVAEQEFVNFHPPEDDFRTLDRMIAMIDAYGRVYPQELFDLVILPNGKPFVEVPFALPFGEIAVDGECLVQDVVRMPNGNLTARGEPYTKHIDILKIVWCGRIDLAYSINNSIYIMDHKTASIATNMAEFQISHQFSGYTWAAETLLAVQVDGVIINRIVVRKPTRTGEAFTFDRQLFGVQRGLVNEWKTDILHIIADFVEMVRRGYMPKHTQWCVGKFGTCQFHKVCTLGDDSDSMSDQRRMILESGEFEENVWSPLVG